MLTTTSTLAAAVTRGVGRAMHALTDLTERPRTGLRGVDAHTYLTARGFDLPVKPNQAVQQEDGSVVAALSNTEYFLLGSEQDLGSRIAQLENDWVPSASAHYLLPRQDSHAWLTLSGPRLAEVMAKVCGVDLRGQAFPVGSVAQTSVARVNAIVIHDHYGAESVFHLLFDRCSLEYFRGAMLDALVEFHI